MFSDLLGQLAVVAVFVQRVLDLVKQLYEGVPYEREVTIGLSVAISAALCVAWGIDAFVVAGIVFPVAWLGAALTGLFAGLGSNVINDILALLELWKENQKMQLAFNTVEAELDAVLDDTEEM